ncbi:MAG: FAD-dependent oxidoreductase [Proteobacteria bacterium]|nr:FAD-dependent oxidoreductase [Pseudomonadota bacterium]
MADTLKTDIVVIGGGISGLWLLNAFKQLGFNSLLLEKNTLGGDQTIASQGMIHGGIKYTLGGFSTPASISIASMPETWRNCLSGAGTMDLRQVDVLSNDYYLFSDGSISSKLTAFLGSKSIRSRVSSLPRQEYPKPFSNAQFKGWLYQLQDLVINTSSLLTTLQNLAEKHTFRTSVRLVCNTHNQVECVQLENGLSLKASLYVLAAGAGNADLLAACNIGSIKMQRRPLHQVMLCSEDLPSVFAHAVSLGSADKPRITITTHKTKNGVPVWYLGGDLAETGVRRSEGEQIDFAQKELSSLFPWMTPSKAQWATHRIDRAEPAQAERNRPDHPYHKSTQNLLVCWPTKLTLVPMMAESICATLTREHTLPAQQGGKNHLALPDLPIAEVSPAPWEAAF